MLEKKNKTTYFKMTLLNTGNELKGAIWTSGTPEQFLMHVRTALHACKRMGLDANFKKAKQVLELRMLDADVTRQTYSKGCNAAKKKKGEC